MVIINTGLGAYPKG